MDYSINEHPIFKLYYDDVEVANPLGSSATVHKLGVLSGYQHLVKLTIQYKCNKHNIGVTLKTYFFNF